MLCDNVLCRGAQQRCLIIDGAGLFSGFVGSGGKTVRCQQVQTILKRVVNDEAFSAGSKGGKPHAQEGGDHLVVVHHLEASLREPSMRTRLLSGRLELRLYPMTPLCPMA